MELSEEHDEALVPNPIEGSTDISSYDGNSGVILGFFPSYIFIRES